MNALAALVLAPLLGPQEEDRIHVEQPPVEFVKRWEELQEARRWGDLVELYEMAREKYRDKLCPASAGDVRFLPLLQVLAGRLAAMPEESLAVHETAAQDALGSAADPAARGRTIERFAFTRAAHDALVTRANRDFDEGHVADALRAWTRALEARPAPELVARIARAQAQVGDAAALGALRFRSEGRIVAGGREIPLTDLLENLVSAPTPSPRQPRVTPSNEVALGRYDLRLDEGAYARSLAVSVPAAGRVGSEELIVFTNGIRVTAIDPARGEGGSLEDAVRWRYPVDRAVRALPTPYGSPVPSIGAAVSGGRAFVVMFSPRERSRLTGRRPDRFDGPTTLCAFDLRTGKLLWNTDEIEIDSDGEKLELVEALKFGHGQRNFAFAGPPIVRGDRVLAIAMTTPNAERECYVACLSAADGRPIWSTYVASAQPTRGATSIPTFTEEGGLVFVQTNFGVAAALDAATGAIEWAVRYPTTNTRYAVSRPVVHGSRVVFLPQDREEPVVLDRLTGRPSPLPALSTDVPWWRVSHLLGMAGEWLVVAGQRSFAVRPADGKVVEFLECDASRPWRGAIAEARLYMPTPSALQVYDTETWKLLATRPWGSADEPGNVLVTDTLLVTLGEQLNVSTSAEGIRERFPGAEAEPPVAAACLQAARLLERSGQLQGAVRYYRRALGRLDGAAAAEVRRKIEDLSPPPDR
jgi:outer membrane protein assembly factor BamB